MSFKSKCTDSTAIMKMLDNAKVGDFDIRLLRIMRNEFKSIFEAQGFTMAIAYAYQLGQISGISGERTRRRMEKYKHLDEDTQRFILDMVERLGKTERA